MSRFRKFGAFVRVQRGVSEIFENQKLQPTAEIQLWLHRSLVISVIYIWSVAFFGLAPKIFFSEDLSSWSLRESQSFSYSRQQFCRYIYSGFFLSGSLLVFWCIDLESSSFAAVLRGVSFKQPAARIFPLGSLFTCVNIALHCLHCFVVTSFSG